MEAHRVHSPSMVVRLHLLLVYPWENRSMVGPRSSKPLYGGSIPSSLAPLRLGFDLHMASLLSSSRFLQLVGAFRCGTCLLVIGAQNPVHSLLLLIRVFALGTLLLFTLHREYFALIFTDKEKAETELSNLEGKIVMGYDEFRIDSWVENEKCYDEDSITNLTDL